MKFVFNNASTVTVIYNVKNEQGRTVVSGVAKPNYPIHETLEDGQMYWPECWPLNPKDSVFAAAPFVESSMVTLVLATSPVTQAAEEPVGARS